MVIDLKNRHWCPAIETKETNTELALQVEVLEIQAVVELEVCVEPTHISITAVYLRNRQERERERIAFQLHLVYSSKNNAKSHQAYKAGGEIIESYHLLNLVETETDRERFECYIALPAIVQTQGIKTELSDNFLTITAIDIKEIPQIANLTKLQLQEFDLDFYELAKLYW